MEQYFIGMLKEAMIAYKEKDIDRAFEVAKNEKKIDELFRRFKDMLQKNDSLTIKQAFYLSGLFRNIERSGDHTINICEHIVYLVKGVQYDFD